MSLLRLFRLRRTTAAAMAVGCASMVGIALTPSVSAGTGREETVASTADSRVDFHRWTSTPDLAHGQHDGTRPGRDAALRIAHPVGELSYTDPFGHGTKTWEYARWTSPWHEVGFGATELVASWTAATPPHTWLQVEMRGTTSTGERTGWYVMGRWAHPDAEIHRTSVPDQKDEHGRIVIDTFKAAEGQTLRSYQLRATLLRLPGTRATPVLRSLGAMASYVPHREHVPASPGGGAWGTVLDVPQKSQNVHNGHYPQWDGGGEAWCSPTSTAMVLDYWDRGPSKEDLSWVKESDPNPEVDYAARYTYDYNYEGAGNWSFNIAYAGHFGLDGFVTRLRSLTELERFITAGIPVITSLSFEAEELPGAGYGTNGHLLVVVGFTEDGDVVVNDPAADTNADVRRVYPRAAFENVWQRSSSTGGISYIIHPPEHDLPAHQPGDDHNWPAPTE